MIAAPRVALLVEASDEYGRGLLRGIVRYAQHNGPWSIYIRPGQSARTAPEAGTLQGDGVIARVRSAATEIAIRATGLPVAVSSFETLNPNAPGAGYFEIGNDSPAIARMAARHLKERGLRHFAFCGFRDVPWSTLRETVFRRHLADQGLDCGAHRIERWMELPNSGMIEAWERERPALAEWLHRLPRPVGLMACNDICGREVLQACAEAGLRVPDDVAVIGVDDDELLCGLADPPLSSVVLDLERAGYQAAGMLDALISGRTPERSIVAVEPMAVSIRRSTELAAADDPAVARAVRFIHDNAARQINVPDVAREARVSRRTLERRFADVMGRTVLEEITRCRLERAKRLLLETDMPVYRVAPLSGFSSAKNLIRVFQLSEGQTATMFRDRFAAEPPRSRRSQTQQP
jgi:LacI family transcriptional regulator